MEDPNPVQLRAVRESIARGRDFLLIDDEVIE